MRVLVVVVVVLSVVDEGGYIRGRGLTSPDEYK